MSVSPSSNVVNESSHRVTNPPPPHLARGPPARHLARRPRRRPRHPVRERAERHGRQRGAIAGTRRGLEPPLVQLDGTSRGRERRRAVGVLLRRVLEVQELRVAPRELAGVERVGRVDLHPLLGPGGVAGDGPPRHHGLDPREVAVLRRGSGGRPAAHPRDQDDHEGHDENPQVLRHVDCLSLSSRRGLGLGFSSPK